MIVVMIVMMRMLTVKIMVIVAGMRLVMSVIAMMVRSAEYR